MGWLRRRRMRRLRTRYKYRVARYLLEMNREVPPPTFQDALSRAVNRASAEFTRNA